MSLPDSPRKIPSLIRLLLALSLAGLAAGCFEPLYGNRSVVGGSGVGEKLSTVDVAEIEAPNGSRLARIGVGLRNDLIFAFNGGGSVSPPAYRLVIRMAATQQQVIVDINSARTEIQNYAIDAFYNLHETATGRLVVQASAIARVSFNIPGQEQRFAGDRGLRDAEDRAAKVIADSIRSRLTSYFAAGT